MPTGWSSPVGRLLSRSTLGMLSCVVPPALVDEVLAVTGRDERRFRALPSRLGIYFVLALSLLRSKSATATIRTMFPLERLGRVSVLGLRPPPRTPLSPPPGRVARGALPLFVS